MCGIVACVGTQPCRDTVVQGLQTLEYRGYDSSGFACIDGGSGHLQLTKAAGQLSALKEKLSKNSYDGVVGIGHTRWATHGPATDVNAHPHTDCRNTVAVVHNGIIEHCAALRSKLIAAGHTLVSTTDSELVAHLFSDLLCQHNGNLQAALGALRAQLQGAYALVIMIEERPDVLCVVRRRSPLVMGIDHERILVASDQLAFPDDVKQVVFVPENSVGLVYADHYDLFDAANKAMTVQPVTKALSEVTPEKGPFAHFMLKEIYEQKRAIARSVGFFQLIGGRDGIAMTPTQQAAHGTVWQQLGLSADQIKKIKRIHLIAAGTSWNASRIGQFFFETVPHIQTRVHLASEFVYAPFFPDKEGLYLFVSQSGETADTLEALRRVLTHDLMTVAVTNVASSSIVREAGGFLLMHAGPEISVASTKAFSCQLTSFYWLAHRIALERGAINDTAMRDAEDALFVASEVLDASLSRYEHEMRITLAPRYARFDRMIFLGRQVTYPFALEAALKLKEISYIFAQCYPAGELKHGPIALVDKHTPVILFSLLDDVLYQKLVVNAQEVKARGGHLVIFAFEGQNELIALADTAFVVPRVASLLAPLALTGVMQLFAYTITCQLGHSVDKPRNLAKSVTVE